MYFCFVPYLLDVLTGWMQTTQVNGNYFMENACVRFLFTSSKVAEEERISESNEWGFCNFEYCELRVCFHSFTF